MISKIQKLINYYSKTKCLNNNWGSKACNKIIFQKMMTRSLNKLNVLKMIIKI